MSAHAENARPGARPGGAEPFRLRAANFSLLVLRLLDARAAVVVPAIADQFRRAPGFLRNAPIAIGLDELENDAAVDFATLVRELRAAAILPIGTTGGSPALRSAAQQAGLPPLRSAGGEAATEVPGATPGPTNPGPANSGSAAPEPAAAAPEPAPARQTMVVDETVRAGQRVWAQGCDLVVIGTVNAGAEVIADGNVHVWGALRGRAIAGGADNLSARVFAANFDPELVSIAGYYAVRDGLTEAPIGKAVQARLVGESMRFDRLG